MLSNVELGSSKEVMEQPKEKVEPKEVTPPRIQRKSQPSGKKLQLIKRINMTTFYP